MTNVTNVKTTEVSEMFLVNIMLPNGVGFAQVTVTDGNLGKVDALIGMDIISRGDFSLSHNGGETVFSFRNPSIGATDFVKDDAKHNPKPIKAGFRQPPRGKHSGGK